MASPALPSSEIREVPDPEGGLIVEVRANGLRLAAARASLDMMHDMGISREDMRGLLETSLKGLHLDPQLERQVFGYWFGPDEEIPTAPVGWPTGAVLPRINETIGASELICLDLVPVHNYWVVLSELGRYTYRHTAGLLNGEDWRFVPVKEAAGGWPVVFRVAYSDSIQHVEIKKQYSFEASTRARLDASAVQLRLKRQS